MSDALGKSKFREPYFMGNEKGKGTIFFNTRRCVLVHSLAYT